MFSSRFIGAIKTNEDIKYVRINVDTRTEAEIILHNYAEDTYKGELVSYRTIDVKELDWI